MIRNCPLNTKDFVRVDRIYRPAKPLLQGGIKRRRKSAKRVPRFPLSTDILLRHKNIEIYFNFFNMNRIPFLHINSYKIPFITELNCTSESAEKIIKYLNTVNSMYKERGFYIDLFSLR